MVPAVLTLELRAVSTENAAHVDCKHVLKHMSAYIISVHTNARAG